MRHELPRCSEIALPIECAGESLTGVVSVPAAVVPVQRLGVVIVVGGPQYRAGSHRQFVLMARELAAAGWPALRFDVRGMGDGTGEARSFEDLDDDIDAAITALLAHQPQLGSVVLAGLCDGASAALMYASRRHDRRVAGAALLNPWVRSEVGLARAQMKGYYLRRLAQPAFWRKLAGGSVGAGAARDLLRNLRLALRGRQGLARGATPGEPNDFRGHMLRGLQALSGACWVGTSGRDLTAAEFLDLAAGTPAWRAALEDGRCARWHCADADHTFSDHRHLALMHASLIQWLGSRSPRVA